MGIRKEMAEAKAPLPPRTKLDQLRPFTQTTVKNLSKLSAILDLSGRPHVTPYSKETPIVSPSSGIGHTTGAACFDYKAYEVLLSLADRQISNIGKSEMQRQLALNMMPQLGVHK